MLPTMTTFINPPPPTSLAKLSFPAANILLVTLSRPASLNCINTDGHYELHSVWEWLDEEPSLRVGIITGEGRAFCAGADLKEWSTSHVTSGSARPTLPPTGFGGLSGRAGKKPIIAAVNGLCLGGGCEMVINVDLVLASSKAVFGLPESKRGVAAIAGGLPRLVRTVGKQRAMEMALLGRNISVEEAREWGLVNLVVGDGQGRVVEKAVEWAGIVVENSPDSVIVSKIGVDLGWQGYGVENETVKLRKEWYEKMNKGENMVEGVRAFVEKRKPRWVDSKL